jgi:ubiquinone/menaquinone biosynthesis C-methylase UbiE
MTTIINKYKLILHSELKDIKLLKNNDIIKKDKYLQFIKNNLDLTQCDKDTLIKCYDIKYSIYVSQKFNFQFYYYFNIIKNIKDERSLENLLIHFTNYDNVKNIIKKLGGKKIISDDEIIEDIISVFDIHQNTKHNKLNIDYTCNKWDYIFQNLAKISFKMFNIKRGEPVNLKYLDIGCGNSKKTLLFGKNLKLEYKNIYGTDIPKWGPYEQKKHTVQFKFIKNNKLDYSDNYFDIVTAIFTLHHVELLEDFIKEIYRIIKPNGYLILIEHDSYSDYNKIIFDLEHKLYGRLYDNKNNYLDNPDYMTTFNRFEWNYLLQKFGFKYMFDNILFMTTDRDIRYDKPFYAFYKKNVKIF